MTGRSKQVRAECREQLTGIQAALDALRMESVLVTGGTGFLGTWLAEMITAANDEFGLGVRLFLLGEHTSEFKERLPHIGTRKDVFLIRKDVRLLDEIPSEVSWVIHAAASPDTRMHVAEPLRVVNTIVNGTIACLTAAARLPNLKKFLNVSSGLIYGPQLWEQDAITETYLGKVDCSSYTAVYAESKRMAESICAAFRSQSRLPVVNARPFAFIGPYLPLDRPYAVTNFLRDGLNGGPIRIVGDGETVRSYMYGSDAAAWLTTMLVRGSIGGNYNVGSPDGVTLRDMAERIASALPERPRVQLPAAAATGKRSRWVPDVGRASGFDLGIRIDLNTGLERTLRWHALTN